MAAKVNLRAFPADVLAHVAGCWVQARDGAGPVGPTRHLAVPTKDRFGTYGINQQQRLITRANRPA